MHPYRMHGLLRLRQRHKILVLKRESLYHAIRWLKQARLVAVKTTGREGKRPERTTYRLQGAGQNALVNTLRKIVATPRRESSEVMAAMSFIIFLGPHEGARRLAERAQSLRTEIGQLTARLATASKHVLRINLLESEYLLAMLKAEHRWIREIDKEIQAGTLTWDLEAIFREARASHYAAGRKGME